MNSSKALSNYTHSERQQTGAAPGGAGLGGVASPVGGGALAPASPFQPSWADRGGRGAALRGTGGPGGLTRPRGGAHLPAETNRFGKFIVVILR